jgi:hypothetical protein
MVFDRSSPTKVINAQKIGEPIEQFEPPVGSGPTRTRSR